MPESMRSSLRIGLSRTGLTVLRVPRWRPSQAALIKQVVFAAPVTSAEQLRDALHAALAGIAPGLRWASVSLADEWGHYFGVTPPANIARLADCKALAALRLQRLFELDPVQAEDVAASKD